mgnify:CR=1 FL=1|tara:strand:- start:14344 stop:14763 length:420 start_codon:yes stop_codon:yes gene_type:complete
MNYDELRNKYQDFIIYEKETHSIKLNISMFKVDKYRGNHNEFIQYILFIILKVKEMNSKKNCLCHMDVDMKSVTNKHFSPSFLRKVLKPLNAILDDPANADHILGKICIRNVGKYGMLCWGIVKPLFHKETIAKMVITR